MTQTVGFCCMKSSYNYMWNVWQTIDSSPHKLLASFAYKEDALEYMDRHKDRGPSGVPV